MLPLMSEAAIREWFFANVPQKDFAGKRVLVIIPDQTRTAPLPLLFETLAGRLLPVVKKLDVLVALGTHPALSESQLNQLLGLTPEQRTGKYAKVGLFNHAWDQPDQLTTLGTLTEAETAEISEGLLAREVPVEINKRIRDYDV